MPISSRTDYQAYFVSTAADTTGVALALSTAGSSGVLSGQTSGPGGFPITSTALNSAIDLRGWEGVQFIATGQSYSTASPSLYTLQAYFAQTSTTPATAWVTIQGAFANAYSTGGASSGFVGVVVDVYKPKFPAGAYAVGAVLQVPTSSGGPVSCVAQRYSGKTAPYGKKGPGFGTTYDITSTGLGPASTANANSVTSVNGTS